jgi:hypothetical protein
MNDIEKTLEKYFLTKAPKLPVDIQKLLVQYGPYVLAVTTVISIIGLLSAFGITTMGLGIGSVMGMRMGLGAMYQVYLILSLATVVLTALALPGLFKKSMAGWRYMYYATIVGLVQNIVMTNIAGIIIGTGLGLWILFQIRHHYN